MNNEYLDQYCTLIIQNKDQNAIAGKTNCHHIIPQYYYKINNLKISYSKQNLVHLYYKDHILAHYYICLCAIGKLKYGEAIAFFSLVNRKWKYEDFDPKTDLSEFDSLNQMRVEALSSNNRGRNKGHFPPQAKEKSLASIKIRVQELNDNLVFESCREAQNYYNIANIHWMSRALQDLDGRDLILSKSYGKLFLRLKDQPPYSEEEILKNIEHLKFLAKEKPDPNAKKIFQYSLKGDLINTFDSFSQFSKKFKGYSSGRKFPFITYSNDSIISDKWMLKEEIECFLSSKFIYAYDIKDFSCPIIIGTVRDASLFLNLKESLIRDSYNKNIIINEKYVFSKIPLFQNELESKFLKSRSQQNIDLYLYDDKLQFLNHFTSYLEAATYLNKDKKDIYNMVAKSKRALNLIKSNQKCRLKGIYIFKEILHG